jgi:hypothetical protein
VATVSDALSRTGVQYTVKLYIKNNSSAWVDFTDRFGEDRLRGMRAIHHLAEGPHGHPTTKSMTLTAENSDRYWDSDPASAYDPWEGRDVQIRLDVADATETTLCTMRIAPDGIETNLGADATIKLEPLTEVLARVDADSLKRGETWYQFRPWTFLVQEHIRSEFGESDGSMPSGYTFPSDPRFTYPDGNKHFSVWGKPPQWDGTDWNSDNTDTPYCLDYDSASGLLYVGIAENLWVYTIATDTWEDLGEYGSNGAGVTVRAVYVCDAGVVVCKWDDDPSSANDYTDLYVNFYDTTGEQWDTTTYAHETKFFSGQFWTFNGADVAGTDRGRGFFSSSPGSSPHDYGTAIPIPFQQYVRDGSAGTVQMVSTPGLTTDQSWTNPLFANLPLVAVKQYKVFKDDASNAALKVRVAFGNKPNTAFWRVDSTPDARLYIVVYNTTYSTWQIEEWAITQGGAITQTDLISANGESYPMHSLTLTADGRVSYVRFDETVDATGYDTTQVRYVARSSPPNASNLFFANTALADNEDIILDILYVDLDMTTDCVFVKMKANRMTKFPQFQVVYWNGSTETIRDSSMCYFVTATQRATVFPIIYIDTQSGAVKKLPALGSAAELVDSGVPPVYDAPYCADLVYGTGSDPDIFGLSLPFHLPDTQETTPDGKYFLWQYASTHTGRVEHYARRSGSLSLWSVTVTGPSRPATPAVRVARRLRRSSLVRGGGR